MHQFNQARFTGKTLCQRLIEGCQAESMLAGGAGDGMGARGRGRVKH